MLPRMLTAALLLMVLALTSAPASAFPWPSRWTNSQNNTKGKTPGGNDLQNPPPATTPNPAVTPAVSWPPKASDIRPEATLPKLPSSAVLPTGPTMPARSAAPAPAPAPTPTPFQPTRSTLASAVELGRPQPLAPGTPSDQISTLPAVLPTPQVTTNPTSPSIPSNALPPYSPPGAGPVAGPTLVQQVGWDKPRTVVRGQVEEQEILPVQLSGPPPVAPPPMGGSIDNPLPPLPPDRYNSGIEMGQPLSRPASSPFGGFWGSSGGSAAGGGGSWFCESDHAFDEGLISPVTSPFFFEDPRALTELRPLFLYGVIPGKSDLNGGNNWFFGVQGRLAFSQSWSLVVNKLGAVGFNPNEPNLFGVDGGTGFGELNIGPKWTFWRSESLNMAAAAGVTFQFPIGSATVYQNTGTLGLDPYLSYGWNFGRTSYGSFNFMTSVGYNFSIDDARSEFFHNHYHLSYDVGNLHKFYPLVEVNWYKYTSQGKDAPFTWEGKDLINFGAANAGFHSYVSLALGARFKLNEHIQTGLAAEWDLMNKESSLEKFRLNFDLIFRY